MSELEMSILYFVTKRKSVSTQELYDAFSRRRVCLVIDGMVNKQLLHSWNKWVLNSQWKKCWYEKMYELHNNEMWDIYRIHFKKEIVIKDSMSYDLRDIAPFTINTDERWTMHVDENWYTKLNWVPLLSDNEKKKLYKDRKNLMIDSAWLTEDDMKEIWWMVSYMRRKNQQTTFNINELNEQTG